MYPLLLYLPYFNPRSHEGSDLWKMVVIFSQKYFNPRSHEGSDGAWKRVSK